MIEELIQAWREAGALIDQRFAEHQKLAASGAYTPEDEMRSYRALRAARDAHIGLECDLAMVLGNRVYPLTDGRFLVPLVDDRGRNRAAIMEVWHRPDPREIPPCP
jgi:hypothetical protein